MKKVYSIFICLLFVSFNVFSVEPEYNPNSQILNIPTVKIGSSQVYDVELQLNSAGDFVILGFSNTPSLTNVSKLCTADQISLDKFNQISSELTLEQVNSIIGCEGELRSASIGGLSSYQWTEGSFPQIVINFNNGLSSSLTSFFFP